MAARAGPHPATLDALYARESFVPGFQPRPKDAPTGGVRRLQDAEVV